MNFGLFLFFSVSFNHYSLFDCVFFFSINIRSFYNYQVLDEGKIVEFNVPYKLLLDSNSMLRKLVEQTGKAETAHLVEIAKTAYEKSKENVGSNVGDGETNEHNSAIVEEDEDDKNDNADQEISEEQSLLAEANDNKMGGKEGKENKEAEDGSGNSEHKAEAEANGTEGRAEHEEGKEENASSSDATEDDVNEYTLTDIEDASHDKIEDVDDDDDVNDDAAKLLGKKKNEKEEEVGDTKTGSETRDELEDNGETSKLLPGNGGNDGN